MLQNRQATLAKVWLTCFSLWFYGYFNQSYLLIMICSIIGNYFVHCMIVNARNRKNVIGRVQTMYSGSKTDEKQARVLFEDKFILIIGIVLNLLVLFYFKYFDFFINNINILFGSSIPLKNILLPLGISFFTFQQISFLVDTYRGELKKYNNIVAKKEENKVANSENPILFIDYALFVSFFPQLIAGPIVVHEEMIPQFMRIGNDTRSREEKLEIFTKGVYVFVLGYAKKVLIADTFGVAVDLAYSNVNEINGFESLITILFYSLQIYFDFSGYCDMAKGIAGMFGMSIANNFSSPYKATNIVEFWKGWHITLSRFFTKNIYIPLGGNRNGKVKMYINYLIVFFLSGLWHGAGWNFILWGMLHGVLYMATKWWINHKKTCVVVSEICETEKICIRKQNIVKFIGGILTFIYVSIAWVYFRAASVEQANVLLMNIFAKPWALPGSGLVDAFNLGEFWYILKILKVTTLPYAEHYMMIIFSVVVLLITFFGKNVDELTRKFKPSVLNAAVTAILFLWCVVSLSGVSTFLYFNF